jgi:hypothetical protein
MSSRYGSEGNVNNKFLRDNILFGMEEQRNGILWQNNRTA